jgi:hypothetical protein
MKLAVIGSRSFNNYKLLEETLNKISDITEIVSGGAKGADSLAEIYARKNKIKLTIFYADWQTSGKIAGMIRNDLILKHSDKIIAFWDGISPGTKNSIQKAKKLNKPIEIIKYNDLNKDDSTFILSL